MVWRSCTLVRIGRGRPHGRIWACAVPCSWRIAGIGGARDGRRRGHGRIVRRCGRLVGDGRFGVGAPSPVAIVTDRGLSSVAANVNVAHAPRDVVHGVRIRSSSILASGGITATAHRTALTGLAVFLFFDPLSLLLLFVDAPLFISLPTNPHPQLCQKARIKS